MEKFCFLRILPDGRPIHCSESCPLFDKERGKCLVRVILEDFAYILGEFRRDLEGLKRDE